MSVAAVRVECDSCGTEALEPDEPETCTSCGDDAVHAVTEYKEWHMVAKDGL